MKRIIVLLVVLLASSALFVQCKKESTLENKSNLLQDVDILEITSRFKSDYIKFKNGRNLKSGKIVSLADAIFEMDVTFNSTYAKGNHSCGQIETYNSVVTLRTVNGTDADYDDVLIAYDSTLQEVSEIYNKLNRMNKQLMMLSIEDGGSYNTNTQKLILTITIGFGTNVADFDYDESYKFERDATLDCNENAALGAPKIFEVKLNEFYNPSTSQCRYYFYGNTTAEFKDPDDSNRLSNPIDNYMDYKIFYASSSVQQFDPYTTFCLEYDQDNSGLHEMQEYYDYCKEFIDIWVNSTANIENKKYAPSSGILSLDHTNSSGIRTIKHSLHFKYRKRSIMCSAAEPLPY